MQTKQRDMSKIIVNPTKVVVTDIIVSADETTKSGIIIPGSIREKQPSMSGEIMYIGDGTSDVPMVHKIGDKALYNPRAGQKFEWEGKEYRILDAGEIFLSGLD